MAIPPKMNLSLGRLTLTHCQEWFNLGRKGGGERNGQRYSEQDGAARVHVGRGTEYQEPICPEAPRCIDR